MERTILAEQYLISKGIRNYHVLNSSDEYGSIIRSVYSSVNSSEENDYIIGRDLISCSNMYYAVNFMFDVPDAIFDDHSWFIKLNIKNISYVINHRYINKNVPSTKEQDTFYIELSNIFENQKNKRIKVIGSELGLIESIIPLHNTIYTTRSNTDSIIDDIYLNSVNNVMISLPFYDNEFDFIIFDMHYNVKNKDNCEISKLGERGIMIGYKKHIPFLNISEDTSSIKTTVWLFYQNRTNLYKQIWTSL